MSGCTWKDVPCYYDSKSTVLRFLLYLCEHGTYQKISNELLNKGNYLKKIDLFHIFTGTKDIPAKKGDIGYDGYKRVKGIKLIVLVDLQGLPLSIFFVPANKSNSTLYIPHLKILRYTDL